MKNILITESVKECQDMTASQMKCKPDARESDEIICTERVISNLIKILQGYLIKQEFYRGRKQGLVCKTEIN